ncbi:MAG: hypothetical protein U0838_04245 [Chloroflexota bacterium]
MNNINTPAGWTLINSATNSQFGTNYQTTASFYRVLAGTGVGPYPFTWSGNHAAVGAILSYRGLDTANPIDATGGDSTGNSGAPTSTSITTGNANNTVVYTFGINNNSTFTPPGGPTEQFDYRATSGAGPALEVLDKTQATASATGAFTTASSINGRWTGYQYALQTGTLTSSASLSIPRPTGTTTGMVLVASVTADGGSGTSITPPAGWTLIRRTDNGTNLALASYYRVATGSESANYVFTISGSQPATGQITQFSNVDTTSVLEPVGTSTGNTGSSASVQATTFTTGVDYTEVVGVYATTPTTSFSPPSGMTEEVDTSFPSGGPSIELSHFQKSPAGVVGAKTATAGSTGSYAAQLFGLRSLPVDTYRIDPNDPQAVAQWIPIGFTGTDSDSPGYGTAGMRGNNEAYSTLSGTTRVLNAGSKIAQAIECYDGTYNTGGFSDVDGTNLATPIRMATKYLTSYPRTANGKTVPQAIIIETDGYPEHCPSGAVSSTICDEYTGPAAQDAANDAKAAGILVYTIGYDGGSLSSAAATLLGNMASTKAGSSACNSAENTDGDDFYCAPDVATLQDVFRYVAESLSRGPHLVQLYAQPIVTSGSPAAGLNKLGGTVVTITGKFFTEANTVTFGGVSALSFTVNSDTSITAVAPPGTASSIVHIQVSTPGGTSNLVNGDRVTYGP